MRLTFGSAVVESSAAAGITTSFWDSTQPLGFYRREFDESETKIMGQVGGGFEVRFTPHIGLLNDFSWNVVSGSNNNFGMARTGINFAF